LDALNDVPDHWVNGQPANSISILDRGLAYGDGVFETVRVNDQPILLPLHLQRLQKGLTRLAIPVDFNVLKKEIHDFLLSHAKGILKITVTRGCGGRGYATPENPQATRILSWHASPQYPEANSLHGVNLFACQTTLGMNPNLAGIKHLNRLEQVLARNEWQDKDYQEGLMLDADGHVIECVFSNFWGVKSGTLITPELSRCGVEGVMRQWLLAHADEIRLPVSIKPITKNDMLGFDEIFVSNSVYGVWPVKSCWGRSWLPGEITKKLQASVKSCLF